MTSLLEAAEVYYNALEPSLWWPVKFCTYTTAACYILSVITGNVSQVDRVWTVSYGLFLVWTIL